MRLCDPCFGHTVRLCGPPCRPHDEEGGSQEFQEAEAALEEMEEAEEEEREVEEVEDLLEYYLQRAAATQSEAERLLDGARDLEESIGVSLSARRFEVGPAPQLWAHIPGTLAKRRRATFGALQQPSPLARYLVSLRDYCRDYKQMSRPMGAMKQIPGTQHNAVPLWGQPWFRFGHGLGLGKIGLLGTED